MAEAGKGSKPRPFSVSHDEWSQRWEAIFGRDLEDKKDNKEQKDSEETKETAKE